MINIKHHFFSALNFIIENIRNDKIKHLIYSTYKLKIVMTIVYIVIALYCSGSSVFYCKLWWIQLFKCSIKLPWLYCETKIIHEVHYFGSLLSIIANCVMWSYNTTEYQCPKSIKILSSIDIYNFTLCLSILFIVYVFLLCCDIGLVSLEYDRKEGNFNIDNLVLKKIIKHNVTEWKQDIECCICFCKLEDDDLLYGLECGHKDHVECLDTWFNECSNRYRKPHCPRCRKEIRIK